MVDAQVKPILRSRTEIEVAIMGDRRAERVMRASLAPPTRVAQSGERKGWPVPATLEFGKA